MVQNTPPNNERTSQIAQLIDTHAALKQQLTAQTTKIIQKNPDKTNQLVKSWLLEK